MKSIDFDVSALLIMSILLIVVFFKRMLRGDINRFFLLLLCTSILTTITDIWAVQLDIGGPGQIMEKYISHSLYLVLHNMTTPIFILYCTALTDSWFVGKKRYLLRGISWLPLATVFILMALNVFNRKIFFFDQEGQYIRGEWFFVLYIVASGYIVFGIIKVINCWKLFDIGRWLALISGIGFMLIATVIQFLLPDLLVEMLAGALGLLFVLMMVQRPEEMIDSTTGLFALSSFISRMYHFERRHREKRLILVAITNYNRIHTLMSYEQERLILRSVSDMLLDVTGSVHEKVELYYLTSGRFVATLKENEDPMIAKVIAGQIHDLLEKTLTVGRLEVCLETNVCLVDFPVDIEETDSLMRFAEDLSKQHYKDEVLLARDIFNKNRYDILLEIDDILEKAIRERRFQVYYQPIYSVEEDSFRTAEALVRLQDEKYGFIPPDLFIPAAEKSGAILQIGQQVLEEVCRFIGSEDYRRLGLHYIEVNLSVVQCMEENFVQEVMETFDRFHISVRDVNMEITETAMSDEMNTMDRNINELFSEGICFSLDDFGTGYSNMHRIASLPLSIIKIDKTMVDDAEELTMQIVIENTVKMIKSLGMKIVVEGVETEQQLNQFIALRCDYIQGYYFSRPLPKDEFVAFCLSNAVS